MRKTAEEVQREASQAGLQTTGKWLSWLNNHIFNSDGAKDGIMGNHRVYGTKAHCLTHESDWLGAPSPENKANPVNDGPWVKEDATFLCGTKVPYWEDVLDGWLYETGMIDVAHVGKVPRHAPRGYCKRCVKALKKREQKIATLKKRQESELAMVSSALLKFQRNRRKCESR